MRNPQGGGGDVTVSCQTNKVLDILQAKWSEEQASGLE